MNWLINNERSKLLTSDRILHDSKKAFAQHVLALDGLRGAAVLAVVLLHIHAIRGGYVGVDVFFVLSGFLITSIIRAEIAQSESVDFKRFYIKRAKRLMPALIACVAVTSIVVVFTTSKVDFRQAVFASLYLSDFYYGPDNFSLGHTWSLAVEAQFYLFWPLFLLFTSALDRKMILRVMIALAAAVLCWRVVLIWQFHDRVIDYTYRSIDTRVDALIIGSAAAIAIECGCRFERLSILAVCIFTLAVVAYAVRPGHLWMNGAGFTMTAAASAYVVGSCAMNQNQVVCKLLSSPVLTYIGTISYGLYLYHFPILNYFRNAHFPIWAAILVSLTAASLSWHFFERPIIRRRGFEPATRLRSS